MTSAADKMLIMKRSEAFRLVINCQKKHTVQNLQCFYVNEIVVIRDGKELLQALSSPTTTGYCHPAEENIKLIIHTGSNKKKEERKHLQTGNVFKDIPQV